MASLSDDGVRLLTEEQTNHCVVATLNDDGSVHSTVVWFDVRDGQIAVNSAVGRRWPSNLERDPRISITVYDEDNPYDYVEVRGTAEGTTDGAEEHIDSLAKRYMGLDEYPFRAEGEQRITYVVRADRVRHAKQR